MSPTRMLQGRIGAGAEFLGDKSGAASETGAFKPSVGDIALRDIGKLVVEDDRGVIPFTQTWNLS